MTPASPCIGSTMNATTFGSLRALSKLSRSLYGMISYPGIKGPKSLVLKGSSDEEIAARVLPQKFPVTNIILA